MLPIYLAGTCPSWSPNGDGPDLWIRVWATDSHPPSTGSSGARHHLQPAGRAIGGTGRKVRSMDHGVRVVSAHLRRESFKTLPISLLSQLGC